MSIRSLFARASAVGLLLGSIMLPTLTYAAGPFVYTTNATSVTKTTAVLNAYATGIDGAADISFSYGTTRSLGSQTGSVSVFRSAEAASIKLTGLAPGTKYYFRAQVTHGGSSDDGSILSFTTVDQNAPDFVDDDDEDTNGGGSSGGSSSVRPAVTTLQPSGVAAQTAILNGTIANPNGGEVKVWFQYGIEAGNLVSTRTQRLSGTQFGASEAITGLTPNTTYFVRVVAQNTTGIAIGDLRSFQTTTGSGGGAGGGDVTTLTALTYGTTRLSSTSYRLHGAVLTAGEAGTAWIEWGTTLGNKTPSESIPAQTTRQIAKDIKGLTVGKTYYYRTVAKTASGEVRGATLSFVATAPATGGGSLDPDNTKNPVTLTLTITKNGKETDGDELSVVAGDRVSVLLTAVNTGSATKASVSLVMPEGLTFLGGDGASFNRDTRALTFATDLPKGVTEKSAEFLADTVSGDMTLKARLQSGSIDVFSNEVLLKKGGGAIISGGDTSGFWSGLFSGGGSCTLLWILIIVFALAYGMIKVYTWLVEHKREREEHEPPPVIKLPE